MFPGAIGHRVFGAGSSFRGGWCAAGGGGLIAVFRGFFASVGGVFIWRGEWLLGYYFGVFRHFPNIS